MSSSQVLADPSDSAIQVSKRNLRRFYTWQTLPNLEKFTASTILCVGRQFFLYSPNVILKLGGDEGEATMIEFAHDLVGSVVPRLEALVSIIEPRGLKGILMTRQAGVPLVELWPKLGHTQCETVRKNLVALLVQMRTPRFDYYGRPSKQPYMLPTEKGSLYAYAACRNCSDWNDSRIKALRAADTDKGTQELEQIQEVTSSGSNPLVNSPVLTHGDLSDRNILLDPTTLDVTGLIDWETANIAPAYFEYVQARLSGGHLPEWRQELLKILRDVLRIECERKSFQADEVAPSRLGNSEGLFGITLSAWKALVDVERIAQGYSDACFWTFEDDS